VYNNNYWPDWGPIISSPDVGDPLGAAAIFQVGPFTGGVNNCDGGRASSGHGSGIVTGLGDGSVRFVAPGVSPNTWWAAMTPAGLEVLDADW
jgi:hypothetical protein